MTLKYWSILLCLALVMVASCGPKKKNSVVTNTWDASASCSAQERVDLTKKANEEYGLVILPKMADPDFKGFCFEIRRVINAIDLLPAKVRGEYERLKGEYGLKIKIGRHHINEDGNYYREDGDGIYSGKLSNPYITIRVDAKQKTLWREIGHFFAQAMPAFSKNRVRMSWNTDKFLSAYHSILKTLKERNEHIHFMKNKEEGFAESFAFYISNQVEEGRIGHEDYKIYTPLFSFFDELLDNPQKMIVNNNDNRRNSPEQTQARRDCITNADQGFNCSAIRYCYDSKYFIIDINWNNNLAGRIDNIRVSTSNASKPILTRSFIKVGDHIKTQSDIFDIEKDASVTFSGTTKTGREVCCHVFVPRVEKR